MKELRQLCKLVVWALLCAGISVKAQLTAITWNPAGNPSQPSDNLWATAGNWSGGVVPTHGYKAYFNAGAAPCLVNSAVGGCQISIGDGGPGGVLIVTNGGSLSAGDAAAGNNDNYAWTAIGYSNTGEMDIENGGSVTFNYHLWIGLNTGATGTFIMRGGTASVAGAFGLGFSGGTGIMHINGGTLTLSQWAANSIQGTGSVLDIGGGTVVIAGNQMASVNGFIASGKITGYGGTGVVSNFFNGATTTLTASLGSGPPATNVVNLLSINLVNSNLVLSWPTSAVYFVLKSATNLAAPVVWNTVTNNVTTSNGTNQVVLSMSGQRSFFRLGSGVDASTMHHKLLMGYQGWFAAQGDGSAQNSWVHWFHGNPPNTDNLNIDLWPDMSELDPDELFTTSMTYSNGTPAKLYSAYKQKTVVRHFKWMAENNLDGVFFQRFLTDIPTGQNITALRNQVAINVRVGAETYGRVFAIMYDISGYPTNTLVSKLTNDWLYLVNTQHVTNSPSYLHHNGKPVVAIWGFGFSGRDDTPDQAQAAIDWFKAAGCTVMGGLPTNWRTLNNDAQSNPAWSNVFRQFDVISPWAVGRYGNNSEADNFRVNQIVPDLAAATAAGRDYMPVIFPGFSWHNMHDQNPLNPLNQTPRNGGNFYWRQAWNAVRSGCTMIYGAMYDEVDEGTAMFKMATTLADTPQGVPMVTLNMDGTSLPGDWYLKLADQAGKMLRGEIPLQTTIPISPP